MNILFIDEILGAELSLVFWVSLQLFLCYLAYHFGMKAINTYFESED